MNQKPPVRPSMSNIRRYFSRLKLRSVGIITLGMILFSLLGNWAAQSATTPFPQNQDLQLIPSNQIATVDWVPPRFQLAQQLYLENCASCHVGLPPEVLPSQTWRQILQDSQHYGRQLPPLVDPPRLLIWNYLQTFSRPINIKEEPLPYRVERSRFFKAIHPRVQFSQSISVNNCINCHPAALDYSFKELTPEWNDSP